MHREACGLSGFSAALVGFRARQFAGTDHMSPLSTCINAAFSLHRVLLPQKPGIEKREQLW